MSGSGLENSAPRLFIFDEPTTGLHFDDIGKLLTALQRLVDAGNTVLVIEHNMDVVKTADWIIDLGPDGGDDGGRVVASGPPGSGGQKYKIAYRPLSESVFKRIGAVETPQTRCPRCRRIASVIFKRPRRRMSSP